MTNLATNRNHMTASRLYALATDARRRALKDDADRALAAIHADQARSLRALALRAARNGTLTSEPIIMTNLTTNRNHRIAARLYALAADARRSALKDDADREIAALQADQARRMRARAAAARNGIRIY